MLLVQEHWILVWIYWILVWIYWIPSWKHWIPRWIYMLLVQIYMLPVRIYMLPRWKPEIPPGINASGAARGAFRSRSCCCGGDRPEAAPQ